MKAVTPIVNHTSGRRMAQADAAFNLAEDQVGDYRELTALGLDMSNSAVRDMAGALAAMDANVLTPTITTQTVGVPVQFLQQWLPGLVRTITQARKIDRLVGISIGGNWEDEEIIQGMLEPTGFPTLYGDYTNVPLSDFQLAYERRGVVRFEQGIRVGKLEDARMSRVNVSAAAEKRLAASVSLEVLRNRIGFFGYNGGEQRVFGFLNDPNLPAYTTVPNGASGSPLWANKTFLEITADIRAAMAQLVTQSGDTLDAENMDLVLALPTSASQAMSITSEFGNSVRNWVRETYPRLRIETAPELVGANGGASVFYLYAERVDDGSSDGGRVFDQIVPAKMVTLGVEQQTKAYIEDYTNALAGILVKRPWAIVRRSGI